MTPRGDVKIKERADALDMGDLPTRMGDALRRAQITVFEDFIARLAPEDIRPAQYSALKLIGLNPGARQTDVSAALGIQRSNFGPLFDGLEQRGLVERRRSQGDRRSLGLYLTDAGLAGIARLDVLVEAHEAKFARRIGAQGRVTLQTLLHLVISGD